MLRFVNVGNREDFVEIDLARQEQADLPSRGDGYVTILVSSAGFAGHNDLWIDARCLCSFCSALIALERDRRGAAVLKSVSPGELELKVRSIDSLGHMCVEGSTGYRVQERNFGAWHAVSFGFEIDPSQLVDAASVEWIRRNANA